MSSAEPILQEKFTMGDGYIVQMKVWQVPTAVRGSKHRFKYSLFFGKEGKRIIAYDNEAGKGDHRHYEDLELAYTFTTKDKLLDDFIDDIEAWLRR